MLDFTTLYIIILLNSIGFAIVWATISITYRSLASARYWFAATAVSCLSGPVLLLGEDTLWLGLTGNLLVVLSFGLIWQGIRVFFDREPQWFALALMLAASVISILIFGSDRPTKNLVFALGHAAPMVMALVTLTLASRRQSGTFIAIASCCILLFGVGSEATTNALRLMGLMSDEVYYTYADWILVCTILGGSFINLGFLLMAVERLRAELHALATRDELTGLPNRRAFSERLVLIEKRAKRLRQNVVILMMDLDKFKQINDNHGHPAGDAALIHVAEVAKKNLREMDFMSRFGGDEFCVLMPDTDLATATVIAKTLAHTVMTTPFYWRGTLIPISAGIGLNHWEPHSVASLSASLVRADEALIRTKRKARDTQTTPVDSHVSEPAG